MNTKLLGTSFLILLLISCAANKQALQPLTKDQISARRLWQRISKEEDYKKNPFWPGHAGMQMGQAPHGRFHQIFINKAISRALPLSAPFIPVGGIIVKENFNNEKKLTSLSVMAKIAGYDPENHNWFWAQYKPDGSVEAAGNISSCLECHMAFKDNDYIMFINITAQ